MSGLGLDRGYANYSNKNKCSNQHPTILDRDTVFCDGELMDKDIINRKCMCTNSTICKQLVDLLNNKKFEEVEFLLDNRDNA